MTVKMLLNQMGSGAAARDYLRLVNSARHREIETQEFSQSEAQSILETIQQENEPNDLDINIEGKTLINQMDRDFAEVGLVPYWYTVEAKLRGEGIYPGVRVIIIGDPSRKEYETIDVSFSHEATRIRDDENNEFVVPWDMVAPVQGEQQDRPYWFTTLARQNQEDLQIGDYVRVDGMPHRYELTDIFWQYGAVEVRAVGSDEFQVLPWKHVEPWETDK